MRESSSDLGVVGRAPDSVSESTDSDLGVVDMMYRAYDYFNYFVSNMKLHDYYNYCLISVK